MRHKFDPARKLREHLKRVFAGRGEPRFGPANTSNSAENGERPSDECSAWNQCWRSCFDRSISSTIVFFSTSGNCR